jgi:anti-anti-sigma factor
MDETNGAGDRVLLAQPEDDVVVVRTVGRGNLELSPNLRLVSDRLNRDDYSPRYVMDLCQCDSLDSTYMGVMASMGMHQSSCGKGRLTVVNASDVTERQLNILGLNHILDIHKRGPASEYPPTDVDGFSKVEAPETSRYASIVHMIESHQALVDAHTGNEVKFRNVMAALANSLQREKDRQLSP